MANSRARKQRRCQHLTEQWIGSFETKANRQWTTLLRSRSGRSHVTLPVPRGCFKPTYIPSSVFRAFVCSDQWASRSVVIVYAAPITGANVRKKMKATHWLVYFRECRFEAARVGTGSVTRLRPERLRRRVPVNGSGPSVEQTFVGRNAWQA